MVARLCNFLAHETLTGVRWRLRSSSNRRRSDATSQKIHVVPLSSGVVPRASRAEAPDQVARERHRCTFGPAQGDRSWRESGRSRPSQGPSLGALRRAALHGKAHAYAGAGIRACATAAQPRHEFHELARPVQFHHLAGPVELYKRARQVHSATFAIDGEAWQEREVEPTRAARNERPNSSSSSRPMRCRLSRTDSATPMTHGCWPWEERRAPAAITCARSSSRCARGRRLAAGRRSAATQRPRSSTRPGGR